MSEKKEQHTYIGLDEQENIENNSCLVDKGHIFQHLLVSIAKQM